MSTSGNANLDTWKKLRHKVSSEWSIFIGVICNPWVLILFLLTVALIVCSVKLHTAPAGFEKAAPSSSSAVSDAGLTNVSILQAFLTVMISIFSGLIGAILASRWAAVGETSVLITRGKSAIRGLKLLLLNLSSAEKRAVEYLKKLGNQPELEVVKFSYEETIGRLQSLQEETTNAIEEWQDIIPEANITTQIGVISQLKIELAEKSATVQDAKQALAEARQASAEDKKALQKRLEENQKELARISGELSKKLNEFTVSGFGTLSGLTVPEIGYSGYSGKPLEMSTISICGRCGRTYEGKGNCPYCSATPPSSPASAGPD
jgi:rubrerythrin